MIYLDNSATTIPHTSVIQSYKQATERFFGNPSSLHPIGGEAEKLLTKAREQAAQLIHVKPNEIIFTSGGTEGNNLAIKGIALEHQSRGKHIITTEIEHPSVFDTCTHLEDLGFEITYLPVNKEGRISIEDLKYAIRDDTILVSVMHVNNELGSIGPIFEIGSILKAYPKIFFHVDDVQGFGKVPLSVKDCHIDLYTLSGHKIHGLKGTGLAYVREGTKLFPLLHGGNQEMGFRSGTENVAGAVSFVKAMRLIKERENTNRDHLYKLHHFIVDELQNMDRVYVNVPENAAPHIINISIPPIKPEVMVHTLSEENIFISTKSACSSKSRDESRVLKACGFSEDRVLSGLRISLSYENTIEELKTFIHVLNKSVKDLMKVME